MDMDIPDIEELEWLESHAIDDSFEAEIEPPSPPSSPKPERAKPPEKPVPIFLHKPSNFKPELQTSANDMDIPDIEELEWLESHDLDDSFDAEIEPPSPPSLPEPELKNPPEKPAIILPHKPSTFKPELQTSAIAKKRFRSVPVPDSPSLDTHDVATDVSIGKRSRSGPQSEILAGLEVPSGRAVGCAEARINGNGKESEGILLSDGESDDDEWLKYAPSVVEEEMVVEVEREETIVSRFATQIEGDCVPITGLDGERVYAKICRIEMDMEERKKKLSVGGDINGLLQKSVRVLMQQVEQNEFTKALQASVTDPTEVATPKATVTNEQLWVDKYAPTSFTELLSDEQTNREVLLWLKQWDSYVFGSEIKSTTDDVLSALRRHSSTSQHSKQSVKNYFGNKREPRLSRDDWKGNNEYDNENVSQGIQEAWEMKQKSVGPPEQKILLLCGPPGLGKTTLAHIAARHCGYRVVEINASDDRSASTVEAKILDVVQMNSVLMDSKPKCLVIDEIDGALGDGKGAVEIILKLVLADRKTDAGKENIANEERSGQKSRKKQTRSSLLRPIICICNDVYVPALRPLRQVAKVHIFVQPTVSRVASRLKYICNKEGVRTSSIALSALAEYTECDIRSCLNTLQFLNKKKEMLNMLDVSSQVVGRKDASKSAFDVWKEIFQKKRQKQTRKSYSSSNSVSKDFELLYFLISNRGDYDVILDGIHENILQLSYVDPMMQKTVKCLDNMLVSDMAHRYIMRTQRMHLQVYQPPVAICIRALIAQHEKIHIEWPKSFQRYRTILAERMEMFKTWKNQICPYISRHLSVTSFAEDSITQVLHILFPPTLRPVALHLLSENEKNDLDQLVNTMVSYAITYKNIRSDRSGTLRHKDASDASSLSLDPPIRDLVSYKDYNSYHVDLGIAVKQVLVHEVEKQKILNRSINKITNLHPDENHSSAKNDTGDPQFAKLGSPLASVEKNMTQKVPIIAKHSRLAISSSSSAVETVERATARESLKTVERKMKPSGGVTDFFARFKKVSKDGTKTVMQRSGMLERDSRPLFFKFNEGFTNAVKRPVRIREFLL